MPAEEFNARHYSVPAEAPPEHVFGPEAGEDLMRELATTGSSAGD
jgi:hypothetical protein